MGTVRHTRQDVDVVFAAAFDTPAREWNETATNTIAATQLSSHAPVRRYERFANGGLSSLNAAIDSDDTVLIVKSASSFPTEGNFRILIDTEILLVTKVLGRNFTVVRGQESTTADSHAEDAAVYHVITAEALAKRDTDQFVSQTALNRDTPGQAGRLYLPSEGFMCQDDGTNWNMLPYWRMTPPIIGDFTWVNQGTATCTDTKGMAVLIPPQTASGNSLRLLVKSAPATPYKITVALFGQDYSITSTGCSNYGICFRNSSSGKIITYGLAAWSDTWNVKQWIHTTWDSYTTVTPSVGQISHKHTVSLWPDWVRFGDDGVHRTVEVSSDGVSWQLYETPETSSTFITADQVGFFANQSLNDCTTRRVISFLHWSESK